MGWIRKTLGGITLSLALASGCGLFQEDPEQVRKVEKAKNRNGYLKRCEKDLGEYRKLAKSYNDNGLLKSLGSERWCSKERYDKHEDIAELRYLARKRSLAFCNGSFSEALKSSEKYGDPAGRLMLRRISKDQVCEGSIRGNYESAEIYIEYVQGLRRRQRVRR